MSTIDTLKEANAAPMAPRGTRTSIAAIALQGVGAFLLMIGSGLALMVVADIVPDRQLLCATLFGAAGALLGLVGIRVRRSGSFG